MILKQGKSSAVKRMTLPQLIGALCLVGLSNQAGAAGFAIAEQSVKGLGSAFSGGAASADDASTVWYNPAGMTRFSGTHISAGLHGIFPHSDYEDRGSLLNRGAATLTSPAPLSGSLGVREKEAAVPNFYISHALTNSIVVGLGMNAPFGLVTDYDSDWIGRYHALRSDLATVNINPSIAFKLNEQFSIGFGISAQYVDVKLSKAIDMSAACLDPVGGPGAATCAGIGLTTPGNPLTDSHVHLEGDDWSFGFNIGLLYEFATDSRIGLHYRSSIEHELTGAADFTHSHPGAIGLASMAGLTDQPITASVELPETLSLSAFHRLNNKWSIQGDISWVRWSRFDRLLINFDNGIEDETPEHWENSMRYSVGASYYHSEKFTLRTGIAFEETPIPDASLRTPRIADVDRIWVAVGASYAWNERISFDLSYTHIFADDADIDYVSNFPDTPHAGDSSLLNGEFDVSVDIISAQMNIAF